MLVTNILEHSALTLIRAVWNRHNLTRHRYFLMLKMGRNKKPIGEYCRTDRVNPADVFVTLRDSTPSSWENEEVLFVHCHFHPYLLVTLSYYLYLTSLKHPNYSFTIYGWMNRILNATGTLSILATDA